MAMRTILPGFTLSDLALVQMVPQNRKIGILL
jgi:hypothetical protein